VSDTLIRAATLIAAIAGIVGAIFTIMKYCRERPPNLRVTLSVHDTFVPAFLKEYLRRDLYNQAIDINKKLDILSSLRSYMRLTLHNHGKEKIDAITVTLMGDHPSKYLFQVNTQPDLLSPNGNKVLIGDLQPHQNLIIHIWSESIVDYLNYSTVKNLFKFTANKLPKLTFRFSLPPYLQEKIIWRIVVLVYIFVILALSPFMFYPLHLPF
jgi:hypothetical protein